MPPQNWGTKLSCTDEPWQCQLYNDAGRARRRERKSLSFARSTDLASLSGPTRVHRTQLIQPSAPRAPYRGEIASTQPYTLEERGNVEKSFFSARKQQTTRCRDKPRTTKFWIYQLS